MTREEIKDELYRMLSDVLNGNGPIRNNAQRGRYREVVKSAIEAVEQKPNKWIPVSERLPDDEDYVLVCYEDGHIRTAYYYIDTNIYPSEFEDCCETGWYNYNEDFMYKQDVIAWMPLPEPYKAEGGEE